MSRFFILLMVLTSCGSADSIIEMGDSSESANVSNQQDSLPEQDAAFNVQFTVSQYIPYCGGAYPDRNQLNQYSVVHGGILLINLETSEKSPLRATEDGRFRLLLTPGNYAIKEEFKDVPFAQFLQQHKKEGMYVMSGTDDCYQQWWSAYLGEFEIIADGEIQSFEYSLSNSCFTGNNPCAMYSGPYPP